MAAGHRDRDERGRQPVARIGEAEGEADEDKGQRMLAVLAEIGMRPIARRSQRRKGDGSGQQPGGNSEEDRHGHGIARIRSRYPATAK